MTTRAQIICSDKTLHERARMDTSTDGVTPDAASVQAYMVALDAGDDADVRRMFGPEVDHTEVRAKVYKGCTLMYDAQFDAIMLGAREQVKADVSKDGILSAKMVGYGVHYLEVPDKTPAAAERVLQNFMMSGASVNQAGVISADSTFPPTDEARTAGDNTVIVMCVANGVNVPVLEHATKGICIDYREAMPIPGLTFLRPGGNQEPVITRELYCDNDVAMLVEDGRYKAAPGEPQFYPLLNEDVDTPGSVAFANNTTNYVPAESYRSVIGMDIPLSVEYLADRSGTFCRVAPLLSVDDFAIQDVSVRVRTRAQLDNRVLADHMSRRGNRNVIGIAMQTIQPARQGDLMLHDSA